MDAFGGGHIPPVWLQTGAPLGLTVPAKCHGIFPTVQRQQPTHTVNDIQTPEGEWTNYRSAEADLSICGHLFQHMRDNRWAQPFDARQELREYFETADIILNKLALITKTKPDGAIKRRLNWDFL
jgi:hypothetical protein